MWTRRPLRKTEMKRSHLQGSGLISFPPHANFLVRPGAGSEGQEGAACLLRAAQGETLRICLLVSQLQAPPSALAFHPSLPSYGEGK